jgi:hypothetical protein
MIVVLSIVVYVVILVLGLFLARKWLWHKPPILMETMIDRALISGAVVGCIAALSALIIILTGG